MTNKLEWRDIQDCPIGKSVLERFIRYLSVSKPDFSELFFKLNEKDNVLEIMYGDRRGGFVLIGNIVKIKRPEKNDYEYRHLKGMMEGIYKRSDFSIERTFDNPEISSAGFAFVNLWGR